MRILLINETCGTGSHGRICKEIADRYTKNGDTVRIAYGRYGRASTDCKKYAVRIGNIIYVCMHVIYSRFFDRHGFGSRYATKRFLKWVDGYHPDLVWMHNIHGYYINIELLFLWIKKHPEIQVKWTLHDCWAFTGHCGHYMAVGCRRWMKHCHHCPERKQYPKSIIFDNSIDNYRRKKSLFTNVNNMSIVVPSKWLKKQVEKSFLKDYPIEIAYNTVDKHIFKKREGHVREKYGIGNRFLILGVANHWTERKGYYDFLKLSKGFGGDFVFMMVGLSKRQLRDIPENVIGIGRTEDRVELAEIYSSANVFLNLTYEENYPTVNLEAEACGTPVITYDTGGCSETIKNNMSKCVNVGDLRQVKRIILVMCEQL